MAVSYTHLDVYKRQEIKARIVHGCELRPSAVRIAAVGVRRQPIPIGVQVSLAHHRAIRKLKHQGNTFGSSIGERRPRSHRKRAAWSKHSANGQQQRQQSEAGREKLLDGMTSRVLWFYVHRIYCLPRISLLNTSPSHYKLAESA